MTVTPVNHEPTRFSVTSETDGLPWLVDMRYDDNGGHPYCSCAIVHNRTNDHAHCKHIRAVQTFLKQAKPA